MALVLVRLNPVNFFEERAPPPILAVKVDADAVVCGVERLFDERLEQLGAFDIYVLFVLSDLLIGVHHLEAGRRHAQLLHGAEHAPPVGEDVLHCQVVEEERRVQLAVLGHSLHRELLGV